MCDYQVQLDRAEKRLGDNAKRFAKEVWEVIDHGVRLKAHKLMAQEFTSREKAGGYDSAYPFEGLYTDDYIDQRFWPYDTFSNFMGPEFTYMANEELFKLMRDYNVVPFPNSTEEVE